MARLMQGIRNYDDSIEVVNNFFDNNNDYKSLFMRLYEYMLKLDPELIFRFSDQIIGVSRIDTVYYFYVSKVNNNYFIKFKQNETKEELKLNDFDKLCDGCANAVKLIKNNPDYIVKRDVNNFSRESVASFSFAPDYIIECENCIKETKPIFEKMKFLPISKEIVGTRMYNAFKANDVNTYGDIIELTGSDIYRFKNIGKASVNEFIKGCHIILNEPDRFDNTVLENSESGTITLERYKTVNVWKNLRERTIINLNKAEEKLDFEKNSYSYFEDFYEDICDCVLYYLEKGTYISERNGIILSKRYMEHKTLNEIGTEFEITRERVRQISEKQRTRMMRRIKYGKFDSNDYFVKIVKEAFENIPDGYYFATLVDMQNANEFVWEFVKAICLNDDAQVILNEVLDAAIQNNSMEKHKDENNKLETLSIKKEIYNSEEDIKLLEYISCLKEGIDPDTGEIYEESFIHKTEFKSIIEIAEKTIIRKLDRIQKLSLNAGQPWSDDEDMQLIDEYNAGMSIKDIAKVHERSDFAIKSRIIKKIHNL